LLDEYREKSLIYSLIVVISTPEQTISSSTIFPNKQ
jgi:hypothetical protein